MVSQNNSFHDNEDDNLGLSGEESDILDMILKGEFEGDFKQDKILPRAVFSPIPQSFSQQRLWILDRLVPGNAFYNLPSALRIKGALDHGLLERSLNEVIRRHESLRTIFTMVNEEPVQVILPELTLTISLIDLGTLSPAEQESEVSRRLEKEACSSFDLQQGPLLRLTLLRLGPFDHVLLQNMHHIISDSWSIELFTRELSQFHAAFSRGEYLPLKQPSLQYGDYAVWQRNRLTGETLENQLSYWRELLSGDLPVLELPTDRQRPAISTYRGGILSFVVPGALTVNLQEFNRREDCSLFMTLLTAFNVILCRYSGQEDILVGSPIANRNRTELEGIIGFFANTLVYRTDLSGNPTFRQLLAQVRDMTIRAYDNQDIPFEKLVEELQPQRFMNHNPLFQVMFVLQNVPRQTAEVGSMVIQNLATHSGTSKFDLWLSVTQLERNLILTFEYSYDIFTERTVARLSSHFQALLEAITGNAECNIHLLEIIPAEEKKQLLFDFNNTEKEYPRGKTLHELFTGQAKKSPDYIAVFSRGHASTTRTNTGNINITYGQLNEQSDQLAGLLMEKGARPGDIIAIMMERSVEMVMAMLAILKAGGAYLPLDPELPPERIEYMLKDSNAKLLIINKSEIRNPKFESPRRGHPLKHINDQNTNDHNKNVEGLMVLNFENLNFEFVSNFDIRVSNLFSSNLAYVIYTSGSTGEPKGALLAHEGVVNRLLWMQDAFCLQCDDRVLQKTPYSFDVSVWEFFWTLLNGARLVMAAPGAHKDFAYLVQTIIREKITTIHFVPSALHVFLEEPGAASITSLKRVICSGEALPLEYQERFFSLFDKIELHNLYGPTEASVDVTAWQCQRNAGSHSVPIGRPIANTQIYILDKNMQPVPIGVHGELYIGGIQLARGYINHPELTAEKFDQDLWDEKDDQDKKKNEDYQKFFRGSRGAVLQKSPPCCHRFYKTGDLVRWMENGAIEFLGRLDFQVKVRGFRIELGEIESRLREHPAVHDAVVLAAGEGEDNTANKKLTAYIIPNCENLPADQVGDWQVVFNETYLSDNDPTEPIFNIAGWNSSYTDEPLPALEMQEWVDQTLERIASLAPRRVLEIGCGTGLFLFRLIEHCEYYIGTDIAQQGLDYIRRQLDKMEDKRGQANLKLELLHRNAEDFQGFENKNFDTVIMNSVIQYFPGVEYLMTVLSKAIESVKPGGHIFIGDVRSLPLLKTFHASVELSRAGENDTPRRVLGRVMNKIIAEQELVVAPDFFNALKKHLPKIKHVELLLKYGRYNNELSKFRYDVILHIGHGHENCDAVDFQPGLILDWGQAGKPGIESIRRWLHGQPEAAGVLMVQNVCNLRISDDFRILEWLDCPGRIGTVAGFRRYLKEQQTRGMDPHDFHQLAQEFSYHIAVAISKQGNAQAYDVIFTRGYCGAISNAAPIEIHPWHTYTNNPLLRKMTGELVPQFRDYLKDHLPEYMTPSHFILLDRLPLTSNGKLDRSALSLYEPPRSTLENNNEYVEPHNETEKILGQLWKDLLLLDKISIHDNFFQLGGDSINAIQMISRLNKNGFNLSVSHLYRNMTIAELSRYIENHWQEVSVSRQKISPVTSTRELKITKEDVQSRLPGVEIEEFYPLTPLQKHMLAYYLLDKQGKNTPGLYVNQVRMRVALDKEQIPLLVQALQHLTGVYPYLRTAFMWENLEEPVQVVHKNVPVDIQCFDWSDLLPGERDCRIEEYLARDHFRGFEPGNPMGDRMAIIVISPSECLIIKTSDLMRVDGWSAMVITNKLFEYMHRLAGRDTQPLEPGMDYREYISWLSSQDQAGGKDFWQSMTRDCPVPAPIVEKAPWNQDRKKDEPGFLCRYNYLTRQQTTQLNDFLKQNQITLSALACGVWALLQGMYTGYERVIFGILFSGRGAALAGIETMIGQAINILPMRIDLAGDMPVITWLRYVWNTLTTLQLYEINQQDKIRDWWGQPPGQPLFESYLVLENFPGVKEKSKIDASGRPTLEYIAQMEYPLRVEFEPGPELGLLMQYYSCYFTHDSITHMMKDLQNLLQEIIENPVQKVSELEKFLYFNKNI
ncbi:MAG: amino acid adenylation domain-containing protein [Acidobacteria bacterium]|nr:amino acid adenylation domain-containing protein [Acidobacteriota bacterium]